MIHPKANGYSAEKYNVLIYGSYVWSKQRLVNGANHIWVSFYVSFIPSSKFSTTLLSPFIAYNILTDDGSAPIFP